MVLKKPVSRSPQSPQRRVSSAAAKGAAKSSTRAAGKVNKPAARGAVKQRGKAIVKRASKPVRAARKAVPKPRLTAARLTSVRRPAARAAPKVPTRAGKAPRRAAPKLAPERELAGRIVEAALELKAEAVMLFDMEGQSAITDYILLCSGRSQGHVRGIADKIEERLKARQRRPHSVEGYGEGSWIVMDYGDVIAHIFHPETRLYYDLESLLKAHPREAFGAQREGAAGSGTAPGRADSAPARA